MVGPEAIELLGAADAPPDQTDQGDGHEGGGQEAAEAAGPEPAQGDRARRVELANQQVGDQEARKGEEGGDPEEPALGPRESPVEEQHADDRQRPRRPSRPSRCGMRSPRRPTSEGGVWGAAVSRVALTGKLP